MPFLFPLVGLIAGIIIGSLFKLPIWGFIPISAACFIYLRLLKKSVKPSLSIRLNRLHKIWVLLLFCGIGMFDIGFQKPMEFQSGELKRYVKAIGEIKESKSYASGDQFIVDVSGLIDSLSNLRKCNNLRILLTTDGLSANVGDRISFPVNLLPITDNPNLRPDGYPERMKKSGIIYRIHALENQVTITGYNSSLFNNALLWRDKLIIKLEKSSLSRESCDFIVALLLGDRSFLSSEVRTSFSNAGVAHVLALSGLHVAILMGVVLSLLFPFQLIGWHRPRYIIALLLLWGFVIITGMAASTIRAAIMTSFVVTALLLQRRNSSENALLAALFFILLFDPHSLFDVGLQLSVLCVGSIVIFANRLNPVNRRHHPNIHKILAAILVSMIATATTWVVISYYFQSVPLLFLPVNLCFLPLLPFYLWIAVIYLILLCCRYDSTILSSLLNIGYECFDWLVTHLSSFGHSAISIKLQTPILFLWLSGVVILAYSLKKNDSKSKYMKYGGIGMLCLSLICIPLFHKQTPDSVIFQKNYEAVTVALYDGEKYSISTFPKNAISRVDFKGHHILLVDCPFNKDSLSAMLPSTESRDQKRFLILGGGFRGTTLRDMPFLKDYNKIILHSSIKRKMENKLLQEAKDLGLENFHSLREDGPLEEFLPESLPDNM